MSAYITGSNYAPCAILVQSADGKDFDIVQAEWGYVPGFIKTRPEANVFRAKYTTLNIKSENLFVKEDGKPSMWALPRGTAAAWCSLRVSLNRVTQQVYPAAERRRIGGIPVSNTASMNGANSSIYSSGKSALNAVMRIAALELAPRGIRVNAVSPGPTETEILNKIGLDKVTLKSLHEWMIRRIPLKKMGTAEDVVKMVAYFCGDAAKFITGAEVVMNGGMSLA